MSHDLSLSDFLAAGTYEVGIKFTSSDSSIKEPPSTASYIAPLKILHSLKELKDYIKSIVWDEVFQPFIEAAMQGGENEVFDLFILKFLDTNSIDNTLLNYCTSKGHPTAKLLYRQGIWKGIISTDINNKIIEYYQLSVSKNSAARIYLLGYCYENLYPFNRYKDTCEITKDGITYVMGPRWAVLAFECFMKSAALKFPLAAESASYCCENPLAYNLWLKNPTSLLHSLQPIED